MTRAWPPAGEAGVVASVVFMARGVENAGQTPQLYFWGYPTGA